MKRVLHISWLIFIFNSTFGQTGIISTVIGNGIGGYSGDGGQATNAELSSTSGIALDDSSNIYVADAINNSVIRKISSKTGIITTVVGNGTQGYGGNGGPATSATLYNPWFIAIDKQFNIYFSDCANNVIRKVTYSTGIINTVAGDHYMFNHARFPPDWGGFSGDGGLATNAELNGPHGIALDDSNNIYFADGANDVIRKVSNSSGIITSVIGNGYGASSFYPEVIHGYSGDGGPALSAELYWPWGICFDKFGNMYIADSYNIVIREVNTSGIISTVAGNNNYGMGYSGDGGSATNAEINSPSGLCADSLGNLFLTDGGNNVIRFVEKSSGIISTIAGDHIFGYSGDGGPATNAELRYTTDVKLDSVGNLYIADGNNHVVREVITSISAGKNEVKKNEDISVFPNPAKDEITIQLVGAENLLPTIMFYDLTGREVLTQKLSKATTIIDCSGLSEGAYLIKVESESGSVMKEDKVVMER